MATLHGGAYGHDDIGTHQPGWAGHGNTDHMFDGHGKDDAIFQARLSHDYFGDSSNDIFSGSKNAVIGGHGNDHLTGTDGNDLMLGKHGADAMAGSAGNDILVGGKGDDVLAGDAGNDMLTGNKGHDTFVFNSGSGQDVVLDFQKGQDILQIARNINGLAVEKAADLTNHVGQDAHGNAVVDLGQGHTVTLVGVSADEVHHDPNAFFVIH